MFFFYCSVTPIQSHLRRIHHKNKTFCHESWSDGWGEELPQWSFCHTQCRDVWSSLLQYLLPTGERYDENQFLPKLLLLISKFANTAIFWWGQLYSCKNKIIGALECWWTFICSPAPSFNSEAPENWEPLRKTGIPPARTGASELETRLWGAS